MRVDDGQYKPLIQQKIIDALAADVPPHTPGAKALLLTYDALPAREALPEGIQWLPASAWLLGDEPLY